MKWSWKLGRFAGVDVYLHLTFLLMLGWFAFSDAIAGRSLMAGLWGLGFTLALFGSVLLHEYGHALMARRFGIGTQDITLYPIGGIARLQRMPDDPRQELWVALAGPAVNIAIAALLFVVMLFTNSLASLAQFSLTGGSFLQRLMLVNISLVIFNLLPAFPMDGGRVLRALLALRMNYVQATNWAANLGKVMALAFGIIGLFGSPMLLLVAGFVWLAATGEAKATQMKYTWGYAPYVEPERTFSASQGRVDWDNFNGRVWDAQANAYVSDERRPYTDWRTTQTPFAEMLWRLGRMTQAARQAEVVMVPVMRDGRVVGWMRYQRGAPM